MKDLQAPSISSISKAFEPVVRHSTLIVVALVGVFLLGSVYSVYSILQRASDTAYQDAQQSSLTKTKFDQATIDRIKSLRTTGQSEDDVSFSVNQQRQNPFTEQRY